MLGARPQPLNAGNWEHWQNNDRGLRGWHGFAEEQRMIRANGWKVPAVFSVVFPGHRASIFTQARDLLGCVIRLSLSFQAEQKTPLACHEQSALQNKK
jgi:hypothetical protein